MKFINTAIPDLIIVEPLVFCDTRGFFMETYHKKKFIEGGINVEFVQDNHARSGKGALRGLHFQNPNAQGKLVRVTLGEVYDIAVDIRPGSATFGNWLGIELSAENKRMLYIPPGFAHGYCVTTDVAEFVYSCTDFYAPQHESGIIWNDPALAITWPISDPILSDKDKRLPTLAEFRARL
ncbi:MAG: dTDP-4-dehydrorhamnose 3,5-epimerase [Candidatus Riflebacteria bacterium]|nr:dTDP-4-dehydrorhamnose 3,5-epimerase [Candidatus Riflebacteria bacterium]